MIILLTFFIRLPSHSQDKHYEFLHLSINDGLSNSQVISVMQDSRGYLWFGTLSGLNRYDGYDFKVFRHDENDSLSIRDNFIDYIYEDHLGRIWAHTRLGFNIYDPEKDVFYFNTEEALLELGINEIEITKIGMDLDSNYLYLGPRNGLTIYYPKTKSTTKHPHLIGDTTSIDSNNIQDISQAGDRTYWLVHSDGLIEQYDAVKRKVVYRNNFIQSKYGNKGLYFKLFVDSDGDPWVYTSDANGVFTISNKTKSSREITTFGTPRLNQNIVRGIAEGDPGQLWLATDHGGLNIFNKKNNTIQYLLNNEEDDKSLSNNSIYSIIKDKSGIIWIGTYKKGVSYFHPDLIKFRHFKRHFSDPSSLGFDDVNCFAEDADGNIWIGSNGGGLFYFDRKKETFKTYRHQPGNPNSLSNDVIVKLFVDSENILWIGTFYGGLNRFDGKTFRHFIHDPNDNTSINDDRVYEIFEDSDRNLWIGSLAGGLELLDRKTWKFSHFGTRLPSNYVSCIAEDEEGKLWIASAFGLIVFNRYNEKVKHYLRDPAFANSLSNNNLAYIYRDSRDMMWIGSRDGLNLYNKKDDNFIVFTTEDGLPDNTIQAITEDGQHNLWLTTSNGVSNIIINYYSKDSINVDFKNYDKTDGLQGQEFNANGILTTSDGKILFGGHQGVNIVDPKEIRDIVSNPEIIFTDFQIFNSKVRVGETINKRVVLEKAIDYVDGIELKYNEKIFSIAFAAINYFNPEKYRFEYRLDGFNQDWITANPNQREAIYTNLDPGEYVFSVRTTTGNGKILGDVRKLNVSILPPFWKTSIAFLIYLIALSAVLLLARQIILERERLNYRIKQERFEAHRMHELDMMKIRFFTNISHEFRTPLMLIISPIEKLLKNFKDEEQKKQMSLISRNATRLLKLVNQLLDFRKMEVDELKLNTSKGDVVHFVKEITESFTDLSESSNIEYSFNSSVDKLVMLFDLDKMEKIIYNLLSNAFKFTPANKSVTVELDVEKGTEDDKPKFLYIRVIDTGIGIPSGMHAKIFDRFFQNENQENLVSQGSGIGLALTKEFVKLHDGEISVESALNEGSCFTVKIPVKMPHQFELDKAIKDYVNNKSKSSAENGVSQTVNGTRKPLVLLVEDNEDFRFYLKDNLKTHYTILEAPDGKTGWEIAESHVPDLIVTDIVMPEMNGIELCEKVKNDHKTSHIPVILLSAQADEEQKIKGFEIGADDYVTKPFNFEILIFRIKNLIALRESFKKNFNRQIDINPTEVKITSLDEALIQKALGIVEGNISNPDFSVEELSRELGMSRVHLYKKLSSLTGKSPIEFIRVIRLKRAAQLLGKSQLTVSEIAYKVGFNNPKYFSKYFKAEYKILPSAYAHQSKN